LKNRAVVERRDQLLVAQNRVGRDRYCEYSARRMRFASSGFHPARCPEGDGELFIRR
jgi:hypothetical protein